MVNEITAGEGQTGEQTLCLRLSVQHLFEELREFKGWDRAQPVQLLWHSPECTHHFLGSPPVRSVIDWSRRPW